MPMLDCISKIRYKMNIFRLYLFILILGCNFCLSEDEFNNPSFSGLERALRFEDVKVLIFGKPSTKIGRRMGVVISSGNDLDLARRNADRAALEIKVCRNS